VKSELALLLRALAFAAHKHRDQRRKDAEASPYINHPIALADVLMNEGAVTDVEVLCAALLHDTVEDTATTHEELVDAFGSRIARIVAEVTDDKRLPKAERKRLQVEHAAAISPEAKLVKLADKICNLRDVAARPPAGWDLRRRREYFEWAKQVVDGLRGTPLTSHAHSLAHAISGGGTPQAVASTPAPLRGLLATTARSAQVGGLNTILLISALVSFAAAVASLLLIRERDFVETTVEEAEEPVELAVAA